MANQGLGVLSQAVGQATSTVLQLSRQEELQAQKQKVIDDTNNIITGALKLNDKLVGSGKTPFIVQRDVYRNIQAQESKLGLPTGSALSSYKQFFGEQTGVSSKSGLTGAEVKKNYVRTDIKGVGTQWTNPATGHTFTTRTSEENLMAQEAYDIKQTSADWISKMVFDFAPHLSDNGMIQQSIQSGNVSLAMKVPEFRSVANEEANSRNLESKLAVAESAGKITIVEQANVFRNAGIVKSLTKGVVSIIKQDISLDDQIRKFNELEQHLNQGKPRAFQMAIGDYRDNLIEYIKTSHKDTAAKSTTQLMVNKASESLARKNWMLAQADVFRFEQDPTIPLKQAQMNSLKGMDWKLIEKMQTVHGGTWKDIISGIVGNIQGKGSLKAFEYTLNNLTVESETLSKEISEGSFISEGKEDTLSASARYILHVIIAESKLSDPKDAKLSWKVQAQIQGLQKYKAIIAEELMKTTSTDMRYYTRTKLITNFINNYLTD